MKILHALVGYLTITALPFGPFAFASPLATINYDGYVNTTQNHIDGALMEHAYDTFIETCQTLTSQNHTDNPLMKRVPGDSDIIEARQWEIPVATAISLVVSGIILTLVFILDDNPKREDFTKESIMKMVSQYPKFNWVICHSPYSVGFDGVDGTDWGHTHHELKISFGRTVGYDLYWARSGTFYRYEDGGFINWAYQGNVISTEDDGATVHFGTIS